MASLTTHSPEETHALGVALGRVLAPGDLVGLRGELGAGKTALVRGIAEGAGVDVSEVSSPTFTIIQTYGGRLPLHHADLYRVTSADELYATGFFELLEDGGAALVEWVDRVALNVPMLEIALELLGPTERRITATATGAAAEALLGRWRP